MRRIYLCTLMILGLVACETSISPEQADKFIKFYGNAHMDEARDIAVLEDGSYAICGIDSIAGEGKRAVLLVCDKFGNVKPDFPKYYSVGSYPTAANAMVVEDGGQGGFLLAGYVDIPAGDSTQRDIFLVRTSVSGRELWRKNFGSEEHEAVLHATKIYPFDGGILPSTGFMLSGYQIKEGRSDIMIMGVTDQGDSVKLGLNYPNSTVNNAAANYIHYTGEAYLAACTYDKVGREGTSILALGFDDQLSPVAEFMGGEFNEFGHCIEHIDGNRYLILGTRENTGGLTDIVLYTVETNAFIPGNSQEIALISDANADLEAVRVKKAPDGSYAIVGSRKSQGSSDIFVQFLDAELKLGQRKIYSASGTQRGADVDFPEEGGLVILGTNGEPESSMISLIRTGDEGEL